MISHPVIGPIRSDIIGEWLGTGFGQFQSPVGVEGLAKANGKALEILAVTATEPGTGQFREFIKQAKESYDSIRIWSVVNDQLGLALKRYGFVEGWSLCITGEMCDVMDWKKSNNL